MFPDETVTSPKFYKVSRWMEDEFIMGTYAVKEVGKDYYRDADALGAPEGRIIFAGEATGAQRPGTNESAYASGTRAAHRMALLLYCT